MPCIDPAFSRRYDAFSLKNWVKKCAVTLVGLCAAATSVSAEDDVPGVSPGGGISPTGTLAPVAIVESNGVKIGEGTVLQPILGLETGVISNVFFEASDEAPVTAGILRLIGQIGTGSLPPQRLTPAGEGDALPEGQQNVGSFQYRADLRLSYDFYLSGQDTVTEQNGLGVVGTFRGVVNPRSTWSFYFLENFQRLIRATNFESSDQTNRDINRLQLGLQYAPPGRSLSGLLHFENTIDIFEDSDQRFANRMHSTLGLNVNWRFRPVTVIFADANLGYFDGLGSDSVKVSATPFTIVAGIQTLFTLKTSLIGRIGYTNGFYSSGPSFSNVTGGLQVGYRYRRTGKISALYDYIFQDSINANFFRDHHIGLLLEQQFVPFEIHVRPEVRFRQYEGATLIAPSGPDVRNDVIFAVAAGARYYFRTSLAAVVEYRFSSVETDYRYMTGSGIDDPSFARHELVAGVRAAL